MATDWVHIDTAWEMVNEAKTETLAFRDAAYAFASACEEDGFGGVRHVDMRLLSAAFRMYKQLTEKHGEE